MENFEDEDWNEEEQLEADEPVVQGRLAPWQGVTYRTGSIALFGDLITRIPDFKGDCTRVDPGREPVGQGSMGYPCGTTFFSALIQLIPCRAAVAPFSPIPPSDACCNAIRILGQPCMCVLVNGPPISGVDRSMAMQLPEKCNVNFGPCEMMKDKDTQERT
ncbi:hypothetical protein M8C21_002285 [Ambrosia artemisiifolia]|uniref:Bifunctional inhibitor/plant lipid transfer protein/seed storage helical domain-containing protein n=1 Tax=Ambrosia artemisiifolia TaxID=4212 RepID=A0AAD5G844_AMBAR|nr:hypothetical protein M8C21_002285 [Ambrosia artemisiifolia]